MQKWMKDCCTIMRNACIFIISYIIAICSAGTPITRVPIMAKQPLDLYKLYQHVVAKGGLLEVGILVMGCYCSSIH